jgi:hypothetical protein
MQPLPGPDTRWTALAQLIPGIAVQPDARQRPPPSSSARVALSLPNGIPSTEQAHTPSPCFCRMHLEMQGFLEGVAVQPP